MFKRNKINSEIELTVLFLSVFPFICEGCVRITRPPPTSPPTPEPSDVTTRKPFDIRYVKCANKTLRDHFCLNGGTCLQNHWSHDNTSLSEHFCECHPKFVGKRCQDRFIDPGLLATIVGTPLMVILVIVAGVATVLHRKRVVAQRHRGVKCRANNDVDDENKDDDDDDDLDEAQKPLPLSPIEIKITDHDQPNGERFKPEDANGDAGGRRDEQETTGDEIDAGDAAVADAPADAPADADATKDDVASTINSQSCSS